MWVAVRNFVFERGFTGSAGHSPLPAGHRLVVADTRRDTSEAGADARAMLHDLLWTPEDFEATCGPGAGRADATLSFASPLPSGIGAVDRVEMDWYVARGPEGAPCDGPAILCLDVLQANNIVASFAARAFARAGVHGFVLHLPHSGRRSLGGAYDYANFLPGVRQAMADARRARDVIASLPHVTGRIAIQGTSFGGFVASVSAAFDRAFDWTFLALAGGDVFRVMTEGRRDSTVLRRNLSRAGLADDDALRRAIWRTEPMRLAHRLDPKHTWLFTARRDQVVPPACSNALAAAARLAGDHHRKVGGCHYSSAIIAPWVIGDMLKLMRTARPGRIRSSGRA